MSTRRPARHRAPARPLTPLTTAVRCLRGHAGALRRGGAVTVASSALVLSLALPAGAGAQTDSLLLAGPGVPTRASAAFSSAATSVVAAPVDAGAVPVVGSTFAAVPLPAPAEPPARDLDGIPLDLVHFGNGRVPAEALRDIGQGGHLMWEPAAAGFQRMQEAAAAEGVQLVVTDSYRSYEEQAALARRKGLYSSGGLAAQPGTSAHGWGLSIDLDLDAAALAWMRTRAVEFGFTENVPREPWHWTYTS